MAEPEILSLIRAEAAQAGVTLSDTDVKAVTVAVADAVLAKLLERHPGTDAADTLVHRMIRKVLRERRGGPK